MNGAMILDNFSGHEVDLALDHVKLLFLPPNTTSVSQPMDQGIIKNVKDLYKKMLVEHYWAESGSGSFKQINLLQGIRFLKKARDDVKPRTIFNCFKKCFADVHTHVNEEEEASENETEDLITVDSIIVKDCFPGDLTFSDFVTADDNLVTFAHTDSDDSGSEERPSASLPLALEDSETEADKVTDDRAIQAIFTLINHCSQRAEVDPRATEAF